MLHLDPLPPPNHAWRVLIAAKDKPAQDAALEACRTQLHPEAEVEIVGSCRDFFLTIAKDVHRVALVFTTLALEYPTSGFDVLQYASGLGVPAFALAPATDGSNKLRVLGPYAPFIEPEGTLTSSPVWEAAIKKTEYICWQDPDTNPVVRAFAIALEGASPQRYRSHEILSRGRGLLASFLDDEARAYGHSWLRTYSGLDEKYGMEIRKSLPSL